MEVEGRHREIVLPSSHFSSTYTKIRVIQKRLAWCLHKNIMQIPGVLYIKKKKIVLPSLKEVVSKLRPDE